MAIMLDSHHAADEEAQAEVEVLNSRLEKTTQLTKKIQASLTRLETTGRNVQEAIGPIYSNTQKLQVLGRSTLYRPWFVYLSLTSIDIDGIIAAIDKIRQPSDIKKNEESIIRSGYVL
jgi:exocyst complex protein 7